MVGMTDTDEDSDGEVGEVRQFQLDTFNIRNSQWRVAGGFSASWTHQGRTREAGTVQKEEGGMGSGT